MGNGTVPLSSVPHMPRPGEDVMPVDAFRGTASEHVIPVSLAYLSDHLLSSLHGVGNMGLAHKP